MASEKTPGRDNVADAVGRPDAASKNRRTFHSLGRGRGGGRPYEAWNADELYRKVMGQP